MTESVDPSEPRPGLFDPDEPLATLAEAMAPATFQVEPGSAASFYQERYQQYARSLPLTKARPS
ncbi:MAG: hypothetical protein ABSH34_01680 [Verrucomicrobiota bacterium]